MKGCRPLTDPEIGPAHAAASGGPMRCANRPVHPRPQDGIPIAELLSLQVGDVWQHGQVVQQADSPSARHMKQNGKAAPCPSTPRRGGAPRLACALDAAGRSRPDVCCRSRKGYPPHQPTPSWRNPPKACAPTNYRETRDPIACASFANRYHQRGLTSFARAGPAGHQQSGQNPNAT